jgi:hypothetical protein
MKAGISDAHRMLIYELAVGLAVRRNRADRAI